MLLTPHSTSNYFIKNYQPDQFMIKKGTTDTIYTCSLILSGTTLIPDWPPQTVSELKAEDMEIIINQNPEIVLIGTGNEHHFIAPSILKDLMVRHIGFEVMSTSAACRTYDILVSEGRHVVAGLLIR